MEELRHGMNESAQGVEGPGCHPAVTRHAHAHPGTHRTSPPVYPASYQAVPWPEAPGAAGSHQLLHAQALPSSSVVASAPSPQKNKHFPLQTHLSLAIYNKWEPLWRGSVTQPSYLSLTQLAQLMETPSSHPHPHLHPPCCPPLTHRKGTGSCQQWA